MNATSLPGVLLRDTDDARSALSLASEGEVRYVWQSRYGSILIEVKDEEVFVNGQRVEPHGR